MQKQVLAELEEAYVDARRAPGTDDSYSSVRNHLFSIVPKIMKMMTYWSLTQITHHRRTLILSQGQGRRRVRGVSNRNVIADSVSCIATVALFPRRPGRFVPASFTLSNTSSPAHGRTNRTRRFLLIEWRHASMRSLCFFCRFPASVCWFYYMYGHTRGIASLMDFHARRFN